MLLYEVSGLFNIFRVAGVRKTELQVVGTSLQDSHSDIVIAWDVMEEATGAPWVQISIGENDVGSIEEVLVGVAPAKCVQGPVELRVKPFFQLALLDKSVGIPEITKEHISHAIRLNWHDHLVADLETPAVVIKSWSDFIHFVL